MKRFHLSLFGLIVLLIQGCSPSSKLPIYGERNPKVIERDGKKVIDTLYKTIPDFKFFNQDRSLIENNTVKGKIYIADFFFTSCPTICPIMQKNMAKLADQYINDPKIYFLSFTIDPKHDSIGKLKRYSQNLGEKNPRWYFLTGNRDSIYSLAENGFLATAKTDSTAPGGFIHSGGLILVDPLGRIRGIYDGTIEEEVDKLGKDIKRLEEEKAD